MQSSTFLAVLVAFLASHVPAQELEKKSAPEPTPFQKLAAQLQYRLTEDGRIQIKPDPSGGAADGPFTDLVDPTFMRVLMNGGMSTYLASAYQGDTDIASMADGEMILGKLGRIEDARLFELIKTEKAEPYHEVLLRLLAIRYVARARIKPAIGVLEVAMNEGIADPHTRRAAGEALAELRGQNVKHPEKPLQPLGKFLARADGEIDYVFRYDFRGLPTGRRLMAWGRALSLAVADADLRLAGGVLRLPQVAGAHLLAEGCGAAPYELARRFGNHRIGRVIGFGRFPSANEPGGAHWMRADGVFDTRRLRAGVLATSESVDLGEVENRVEYATDDGTLSLTDTVAIAKLGIELRRQPAAVDRTKLLAAMAAGGAGIVLYLREAAALRTFPSLPPELARFGVPRRIALWLPMNRQESLRVQITCATAQLATLVSNEIKNLPRLLDQAIDDATGDASEAAGPILDALLDVLEKMKVHREAEVVTASVSVWDLDIEALVAASIELVRGR